MAFDVQIRCQRCGDQMELSDPTRDGEWKPQQFWTCRRCGRHFWTTYPKPKPPAPKPAPTSS
ncbi:MAG: hypothetical protein CL476_01480 [Acidobacteria bacterium]|nr:hypothetical protein [Acidobacteriota bacterium]